MNVWHSLFYSLLGGIIIYAVALFAQWLAPQLGIEYVALLCILYGGLFSSSVIHIHFKPIGKHSLTKKIDKATLTYQDELHQDESKASSKRWRQFRAKINEGDEVWEWVTDKKTSYATSGGYVIVRNGKPTRHFISMSIR